MDHFRLRKYRGPEVWARVRAAYMAGEPGPQVAARFDVGLTNLRKKAIQEGWTRKATARLNDPLILATQPDIMGPGILGPDTPGMAHDPGAPNDAPVDVRQAYEAALRHAMAALKTGRAAEAASLLKSAETLSRLVNRVPPAQIRPSVRKDAEIMRELHRKIAALANTARNEKTAKARAEAESPPQATLGVQDSAANHAER